MAAAAWRDGCDTAMHDKLLLCTNVWLACRLQAGHLACAPHLELLVDQGRHRRALQRLHSHGAINAERQLQGRMARQAGAFGAPLKREKLEHGRRWSGHSMLQHTESGHACRCLPARQRCPPAHPGEARCSVHRSWNRPEQCRWATGIPSGLADCGGVTFKGQPAWHGATALGLGFGQAAASVQAAPAAQSPHLGAKDAGAIAQLGCPLQHHLAVALNHLHHW